MQVKYQEPYPGRVINQTSTLLNGLKGCSHLDQEHQILNYLQSNEQTSQRVISKGTGLSLGAVNILIKKMVRKGLVKVEKLNSRTMRYIVTPKGMKEKSRLTYKFIRKSYHHILSITRALEEIIAIEALEKEDQVVLYGPADEIEEILKNALRDLNIEPVVKRPEKDFLKPHGKQLIITWRYEDKEKLTGPGRIYNIMNLI